MIDKIGKVFGVVLDGLAIALIFAGGIAIGFLLTLPFWY